MFVCFLQHKLLQFLNLKKYETAVAYCEFNAIKCQHRSGNMAFPLQQQEMRATTDITHLPSFDSYEVVAATAQKKGAICENTQPRLED